MTKYTYKECRKRLAALWFSLAGLMFVFLVVQSFLGGLGSKPVDSWGWFLANTVPTLSLIASNLVADAATSSNDDAEVDPFYYRLSLSVSAFYLLTILAVILLWRLTAYEEPADLMAFSSVFVGPLQAVAVSIIAIFFKKGSSGASDAKPGARRQ